MRIFPKRKTSPHSTGRFFFGDWDEIPIGLSYVFITQKSISQFQGDKIHYHKKGYEFYFVIKGSAILEIDGKEVILERNKIVMVEPGEKHYVKEIKKLPYTALVINSVKNKNDKVVW